MTFITFRSHHVPSLDKVFNTNHSVALDLSKRPHPRSKQKAHLLPSQLEAVRCPVDTRQEIRTKCAPFAMTVYFRSSHISSCDDLQMNAKLLSLKWLSATLGFVSLTPSTLADGRKCSTNRRFKASAIFREFLIPRGITERTGKTALGNVLPFFELATLVFQIFLQLLGCWKRQLIF